MAIGYSVSILTVINLVVTQLHIERVKTLHNESCYNIIFVGNVINIQTGEWPGSMSGVGAGLDSVYEYLLKSAILFGDNEQFEMFKEIYNKIQLFLRRGYVCISEAPLITVTVFLETNSVIYKAYHSTVSN